MTSQYQNDEQSLTWTSRMRFSREKEKFSQVLTMAFTIPWVTGRSLVSSLYWEPILGNLSWLKLSGEADSIGLLVCLRALASFIAAASGMLELKLSARLIS